jgi:hypothetical protein
MMSLIDHVFAFLEHWYAQRPLTRKLFTGDGDYAKQVPSPASQSVPRI